jgi:hypothetical protein
MLGTVLGLELLLREPCLNLRLASEIVLSDVGATIQILGLVGREDDCVARQPRRMGDCLANLDVGVWFSAISSRTFACDCEHSATTAIWKHCRLVAQYAQLVAESLGGISADDAYLVGLLHEIEAIATVLGWPNGNPGMRDRAALLTIERSLPLFVLAAMRSVNAPCTSSTWRFILNAAHELAGARSDFEASALEAIDSMGICSRWKGILPDAVSCLSDAMGAQWLGARAGGKTCCGVEDEPRIGDRSPTAMRADDACANRQDASFNGQLLEAGASFIS